jgi:hypothetical protein
MKMYTTIKTVWYAVLLLGLIVSGCQQGEADVSIANPASVYCEQQGGTLEIREGADGQYGVCVFDDGSECDEWAFFRGECSKGQSMQPAQTGIGMPNPASVYCEQQGGRLEIREGADGQYGVCVFDDGSECEEWAFFRGECAPGQSAQVTESVVIPANWMTYTLQSYGFSFRYPAGWAVDDSALNSINLTQGAYRLHIGYRLPGEQIPLVGTGTPAGDLIERAPIMILSQPYSSQVLVADGHSIAVLYEIVSTPQVEIGFRGDLIGTQAQEIPADMLAQFDQIIMTLSLSTGG